MRFHDARGALRFLPSGRPNTIIALTRHPEHPLFASWLSDAPFSVEYATEAGLDFEFPAHTALVVAVDTYHEPNVSLLCRAVEQNLPTLILADGILEYRNTWEHPQLVPGSIFQPILGHKIACLGRSQARVLETWGNAGKCEIIGAPRFDRYTHLDRRPHPAGAPFRVLVMTALTPYFTEDQHARVRQSLFDVKSFFDGTTGRLEAPVEAVWRITNGLDVELGVECVIDDFTGRELADVLQNVDAVITTPSTAMLEAMLLSLPVAVLDYCNRPAYVEAAWRISALEHIGPTIAELLNPPAPRMLFQETTLHDALECAAPAAPRLLHLAAEMIEHGWKARLAGEPLSFPVRLVEAGRAESISAENRFQLDALYPHHAPFRETDLRALQVEVGHLREYAAGLEQQVCDVRAELTNLSRGEPPAESVPELAFEFLDHLDQAEMVRGANGQLAERGATIDGRFERTMLLQPPAEVLFEIPVGDAGRLRTAVTLHPEVWEKPESGGCQFQVRVDGRQALALDVDPARVPADRRWHEVMLDVPASASGRHRVTIETKAIASSDSRSAICRDPRFTWRAPAGPNPRPSSRQPALAQSP